MKPLYAPHARAERVIVVARAVLAGSALFAVWLDPSSPGVYARTTYALLAIYLGYALLLIPLVWVPASLPRYLGAITHFLDLLAFSCLQFFTQGPASPFFVYFVFFLMCATLRWQWRGVLWSAFGALSIFIGLGFYAAKVLHDSGFEIDPFVIRSVYLIVVAIILGYLSRYEQRLRGELARLAAWPRDMSDATLIKDLLKIAAAVLDAPRVLFIWDEAEEPWRAVAICGHGDFRCLRESPEAFEPPVADPLAGTDFFCSHAHTPGPVVLRRTSGTLERWYGAPLHPDLQARYAIDSVIALYLQGENVKGYVLALDKRAMTPDDLTLGRVVAHRLAADLDQFYLRQRLREAAVTEERIRLARDLHDGVLQSLTGAALKLQGVQRLLDENPAAARERLLDVQALIAAEQRDMRSFVQQLKPAAPDRTRVDSELVPRLEELCERIERHWGLRTELAATLSDGGVGGGLEQEIHRILQEALVNAARHARASSVRVALSVRDDQVWIAVTDDGLGFPFRGRFDLAALNKLQQGPVSLRERIAARGGGLILESSEAGARLEITLPLKARAFGEVHAD